MKSTWTKVSEIRGLDADCAMCDRRCIGNVGEGARRASSWRAGSRRTKISVLASRIHATVFCRKVWKCRKCTTVRVARDWSDSAVHWTKRTWRAFHASLTVAGCRVLRVCSRCARNSGIYAARASAVPSSRTRTAHSTARSRAVVACLASCATGVGGGFFKKGCSAGRT
jgi:hypothetical protein